MIVLIQTIHLYIITVILEITDSTNKSVIFNCTIRMIGSHKLYGG